MAILLRRKFGLVFLALMLTVAIALSGCTKDKEPKDALQASMAKSAEMKSYSFKGSMKFADFAMDDGTEESAAAVNMLKNAELTWTGAYKADPMQMEINLQLAMKGDLAVTFAIPIVMTQEKMWVKVPNIPMLPIPEDIVGKFVELDLKALAEQAGEPLPNVDVAKSQQLINDVLGIVFKHVDEKTYLKEISKKDANLPDDVDVDQVVQFSVDKSQIEPFLKTAVKDIVPEVIQLLKDNKEYQDILSITAEDIASAEEEFKTATGEDFDKELSDGLKEMNEQLKSAELKANIGIDKNEFPVYSDATVKASFDSPDTGAGSFDIRVVSQMSDVNKDVKFEIGTPKGDDVITFEQLQEQLGGLFGGEMSFD